MRRRRPRRGPRPPARPAASPARRGRHRWCRGAPARSGRARPRRARRCRRGAPRPRSSSPGSRSGTATARRARRPRSPRGCRPSRRPARSGPRPGAGGGPARGSGPRRPAAARSSPGTARCSAGTSGACRSYAHGSRGPRSRSVDSRASALRRSLRPSIPAATPRTSAYVGSRASALRRSLRPSTPAAPSWDRRRMSARAHARFAVRCGRPFRLRRLGPSSYVGSRASALRRSLRPSMSGSAWLGRPRMSARAQARFAARSGRPLRLRRTRTSSLDLESSGMIRRIDLRGQALADYRAVVPRADVRRRGRSRRRPPDLRGRPHPRVGGDPRVLRASSTASPRSDIAGAARGARPRRSTSSTRPSGPAWRSRSRRLRRTCEAELEHDVTTDLGAGAHGHPADGAGRAGSGSTCPAASPRWSPACVMNVVPAQVAGVASIALASSPQQDHGGLPHPTILAACALLGVDEVYAVGGAQAIAMFAYGAGPCARGRPGHRPGQHLHGRGQAAAQGRRRHRLRGRADRDRDPRRRHRRPGVRRRRPDQPGRARPDGRRACWSPTPRRLADEVEAELDKQVSATRHVERIRTALSGEQSGIVLVDDLEQGLAVVDAYAAEHLEIQTARRRPTLAAPGPQRGRDLRRAVRPGLARRLLRRLQPRAARPAAAPATRSGLSVRAFRKAVHVVDYDARGAARGRRPRRDARRGRGPARATARPCAVAVRER